MLNAEIVDNVVSFVSKQGLCEHTLSLLRQEFEDAHFTYCMDDDMGDAKPYLECEGFNVYLVNSQTHCSVLTGELEDSSGLVLADVEED